MVIAWFHFSNQLYYTAKWLFQLNTLTWFTILITHIHVRLQGYRELVLSDQTNCCTLLINGWIKDTICTKVKSPVGRTIKRFIAFPTHKSLFPFTERSIIFLDLKITVMCINWTFHSTIVEFNWIFKQAWHYYSQNT